MSGPLFKFLGLIAVATFILFAIFAYMIFGPSSMKMGDFTYDCQRGGGMFDGKFCESDIGHPYYLMTGEFQNNKPYVAYKTEKGSAGILNLDEGKHVIAIGYDEDQIFAKISDGTYRMFMRTEKFPISIGVLDERALQAYINIVPVPELRPAIGTIEK